MASATAASAKHRLVTSRLDVLESCRSAAAAAAQCETCEQQIITGGLTSQPWSALSIDWGPQAQVATLSPAQLPLGGGSRGTRGLVFEQWLYRNSIKVRFWDINMCGTAAAPAHVRVTGRQQAGVQLDA